MTKQTVLGLVKSSVTQLKDTAVRINIANSDMTD